MASTLLAGDIGGTKTILWLVDVRHPRCSETKLRQSCMKRHLSAATSLIWFRFSSTSCAMRLPASVICLLSAKPVSPLPALFLIIPLS